MKAVVTGGTGFIGSRLALRCLAEGGRVRVLGLRRSPVEEENAGEIERSGGEVAPVGVEDPDALRQAFEGAEVVFHLAAAQHEANVPDEHFHRINVEGTRHVLEAALACGVGRVVHGSTIGVYGWGPGQTVHDRFPLAPDNIYGVTKLAGERVVAGFAGRLPCAVARISETYGPGDRRLLKLFRGARKGTLLQAGPGRNLHHLIYVDDLLDGLVAAAREERAVGRTFVLAGPRPVPTREMLEAIAATAGRRVRTLRVPLPPLMAAAALTEALCRPTGIQPPLHRRRMDFFRKSFAFDGADARAALGIAPRVDLAEGIRRTAEWYVDRSLL